MPRQMKDSGVEWIGEIPFDWDIHPAKYAFSEVKNKNTDGLVTNALKFKSGSIIRKDNFDSSDDDYVADTILNYTIVEPNTIMINGLNLNYDLKSYRVGIVREKGIITSAYLALCPDSKRIMPDYANYLFKGYETKMAFHNMGAGIRLTLGFREFKSQPVLFPSMDEQERIVVFLDSKCAYIDSVIEKTKASIEEYKKLKQAIITEAVTKGVRGERPMKDSGSQWFGDIPSSWEMKRLKYQFHIKKNIAGEEGHDVLSITQKGIRKKDLSKNEGQLAENYSNYQLVSIGDFAMNHMDLLTGWVDISRCEGVTSPDYRVFVLDDTENNSKDYYLYMMQMCYFNRIFYGLGQGVSGLGRWRLQADKFLNFYIPVPSFEEQREIADYILSKTSEMDKLIEQKEEFLTCLDAYKKSLIYEYVTGKKEVPAS